jgi:hypothetical protein
MVGDDEMDVAIEWHLMLLGLAGRVSDDVIARCRALLADQQVDIGPDLLTAVLAQGAPLSELEADFLADVLDWTYAAEEQLSQLEVTDIDIPLRYGFAAALCEDVTAVGPNTEGVDGAAIEATAASPGTKGLWRAWRVPTEGAVSQQARRVYVVEADEDADLISATGNIQRALSAVEETDPQVEVYPTWSELPSYQRLARAHGELLWSRTPDRGGTPVGVGLPTEEEHAM